MKLLYKFIMVLTALFASATMVASNDTVYNVINKEIFFTNTYKNPAAAFLSPISDEYGILEAGYTYTDKKKLHLLNEGESHGAFNLKAEGLTRKNNFIFWGNFRYQRSKTDNIQWSNISDTYRIGPYAIADSIGGDSYGEEYNLSGGLAYKYNKWTFAGEAGYRAANDYRKRDPRPKTTVSDVFVKLSSARDFNKYTLGLTAEASKYQQKISTNVQREGAKYDFFSLKGFGFHHLQLSSQDRTFNWLYKGASYGGAIFLVPQQSGLIASSQFLYEYTESEYASSNRPYILKTYASINELGWQHKTKKRNTFVKLNYDYVLGEGTERTYYYDKVNETFGEYILLYSAHFYIRKTINYNLSAKQEWLSNNNSKWLEAKVGVSEYSERYAYPSNKLMYRHFVSSLTAGGEFNTSKVSTIIPKVNVSYYPLLSKTENVTNGGTLKEQLLYPDMQVRAPDFVGLQGAFSYQYKLKSNLRLYVSAEGNYWFDGNRNRWTASCKLGIRY